MEPKPMKSITTVDSLSCTEPEVLFLARMALNEQLRFAKRVFMLMAVALFMLLAGFIFYSKQPESAKAASAATSASPASMDQVARLSQELVDLRQQLGKAVTETLAMKLASLEERIRQGRAGLQDLELIQTIREDIRLLNLRNSVKPPLQPSGIQRIGEASSGNADLAVLHKLTLLENLFYITMLALAFMAVAMGGYWLQCGFRLKRLDADLARLQHQLYHEHN